MSHNAYNNGAGAGNGGGAMMMFDDDEILGVVNSSKYSIALA